jgi:type II secretory pathway component PulL
MRQLFWFILGAVLATSGLTYAQSWQQQQQTDALNNINNNSNYQRMQQEMKELGTYHNPYAKPPC